MGQHDKNGGDLRIGGTYGDGAATFMKGVFVEFEAWGLLEMSGQVKGGHLPYACKRGAPCF